MVSILVPVYNVEKYLSRCLDSLIHQTYKDIEIILVNDGSTDSSAQICQDYINRYRFIRYYEYMNAGISTTRNRLIQHAAGDLIFFVDSDDYIEPTTIESMINHLVDNDCDLVCCGYTMDYRYGSLYRKIERRSVMDTMEALHSLAENRGMNNYPWGKLFKRECFLNVEFPDTIRGFEDTYTVFKAVCNAKRIGHIPNRFYHYVQHPGSLTHRMDLETVYDMRLAYEYQENYLRRKFPMENFSFDIHLSNSDFMILYTIFTCYTRKDQPRYIPAVINWKNVNPVAHLAYEILKGVCSVRYGWTKKKVQEYNKWL